MAIDSSITTESLATRSGLKFEIDKRIDARHREIALRTQASRQCVVHWGLRLPNLPDWQQPPESSWPEGTRAAGPTAVDTPLGRPPGESRLVIRLSTDSPFTVIEFVLFFPDDGRWDNNGGRNYQIALPAPEGSGSAVLQTLREQCTREELLQERLFEAEGEGHLAAAVTKTESGYRVRLVTDLPGLVWLHWGIARRSPHEWLQPPESWRPPGTVLWGGHTPQTPFVPADGLQCLRIEFPLSDSPLGLQFVLKQDNRWLKDRLGNFYLPIDSHLPQIVSLDSGLAAGLAGEIIRAEMGPSSWTLMHRFNLCHDLLERAQDRVEALALLFVWLRFSAIRQLTWQRNYNTKPRELSHAQDRLTRKLASLYRGQPAGRPLIRLMLATVGPGGEGQRIRDEILNIMHRHHVKEVTGHFLEEWHQKLHNNTTPDDIIICEAYLEFLRSDGNHDRFYQTLAQGGVTRQRLESFERPIRTRPEFVPYLKGGLIRDFENFLRILKAVHAGTDLETARHAVGRQLDGDTHAVLGYVWDHRNDPPAGLVPLVERITEARRRLSSRLTADDGLRELLYLDLALEALVRTAVERHIHERLSGDQLVDLVGCVLENVTLSYEDAELAACLRHWERLQPLPRFAPEWTRHAKSVVDRIGRALGGWVDRFYQLLQPQAEALGQGFRADTWTVTLFSEEVVRGSSLGFVLSMLLRHLEPVLRRAANLGAWQIVSRGTALGKVEVVEALCSVQARRFEGPTVIVTDRVGGDEEISEGITAVIAPDVTDLVSHVAVRARNAGLLFASCHDSTTLQQLKALQGRQLRLEVTAAGDVVFEEAAAAVSSTSERTRPAKLKRVRRWLRGAPLAIVADEFTEELVGGKSLHQAALRERLPAWIRQPASVALPFGTFESVLKARENKTAAKHYEDLATAVEQEGTKALPALRDAIQALAAPEKLPEALQQAMEKAGLPWSQDWEATWRCLKQVWASKWNERAFLSRQQVGLAHEDLKMAVLIQPLLAAHYAFVIHTVHPGTSNRDELYAELVLGLGETLVGNYPGRALSYTWQKTAGRLDLATFPSKSIGLYGAGLIFRSDSSGEDLAGYAGAGLYDSVPLPAPRQTLLDYSVERLVWDESFREGTLRAIAEIGLAVEQSLGAPQDIEGVLVQGQYYVVQARPQVGIMS